MRRSLIFVMGLLLSGCSGPPPTPFKPIANTKLLMQAVIDPAADLIWDSSGAVITADGVEELGPKNPDEWTHLRNSAVALAESGNLLMMSPRAPTNDEEWMRLSRALVDTAVDAIKAAEARNVDDVFTVGGEIYAVCTNCHSKYSPQVGRFGGK